MLPERGLEYIVEITIYFIQEYYGPQESGGQPLNIRDLNHIISHSPLKKYISREDAEYLLKLIKENTSYLEEVTDEFAGSYYVISRKHQYVYHESSRTHSTIRGKLQLFGENFAISALENIFSEDQGISAPAADRTVPIDHNRPEVEETIKALESVVKEARKSNEFAELFADPNGKTAFLSEFESDIDLLKKSSFIWVKSVADRFVKPLKWIQEKLLDWTGSAFVSRALELLENLFD